MPDAKVTTDPPICPFAACNAADNRDVVGRGRDFLYGTTAEETDIVRCPTCGIWHLAAVPDERSMAIIYPPNYYAFSDSTEEPRLVKLVRDRLERTKIRRYRRHLPERPVRVLDIGCGDGRLLDIFRRHAPKDWELSGIEISGAAAEAARAKGFEVLRGDLMAVDTSAWEGRFDLVLMHQVIEHVRESRRVVRKVRTLLGEGGIFSVETPSTDAWDARLFRRRYWGGYHLPRHFYLFTRESLARLLSENGFDVLVSQPILSPVLWIHSIHNAFADRAGLKGVAKWFHQHNVPLLGLFTALDGFLILVTGKSSNQRMLARKTD